MGVVQNALNPLEGYLISLTRDTINGWYELEVGLPTKWVYDENKEIKCEILAEDDEYRMLKIVPKNQKVSVDDLIRFFEIIIETNAQIAKKEEEFKKKMEKIKKELEEDAKKFYAELDNLKQSSFKNINANYEKSLEESTDSTTKRKVRDKTTPKTPVVITNSDDDGTESTDN